METLFNKNIVFVFFFAMIAIYNYSVLKEYQRMAIIYISVYSLTVLNIVDVKLAIWLLALSLFCFFEVFTLDVTRFKILVNPIYKIIDFIYISFSQYAFMRMCCALIMIKFSVPFSIPGQNIIFKLISIFLLIWILTDILQQKYELYTFGEMYKIFTDFPINKVDFNEKLDQACSILVSIEDKAYFERKSYSFLSLKYILSILNTKVRNQKGRQKLISIFSAGNIFVRNVLDESRGYSTIQMQLIRSLGIKRGYNCKYRRKIFEILYSRMFFKGLEKMYKGERVAKRQYFKKYLIYIYFHKVNTFLGDVMFSKFLNAFDLQYDKKNKKDIYQCSNEGIFIACMGLSKRATSITENTIDKYLKVIVNVDLDKNKILNMVSNLKNKSNDENYLE